MKHTLLVRGVINPLILLISLIVSGLLVIQLNVSVGRFMNQFFPCVQVETNSAPCYVGWDAGLFLIFFVIGLGAAILIAVRIIEYLIFLYRQRS